MATKNMTRKATKQNTVEEKQEANIVEETPVSVPEVKTFSHDEGVMCRSVTVGGLFVDGPKTGMPYRFSNYDDETEIEYRDLVALIREKSPFVFHPYFIIENKDFLREFPQIEKFYNEKYSIKDLKGILNKDIDEMVKEIKNLPDGALETLRNIASTQIADGIIDSVSKIRTLNEILGTELEALDSFSDDI